MLAAAHEMAPTKAGALLLILPSGIVAGTELNFNRILELYSTCQNNLIHVDNLDPGEISLSPPLIPCTNVNAQNLATLNPSDLTNKSMLAVFYRLMETSRYQSLSKSTCQMQLIVHSTLDLGWIPPVSLRLFRR